MSKDSDGLGWIGLIFLYFILKWAALSIWHSKARYAVQYGVGYSEVTKAVEPHDCDFFKAPIGSKECHYDAEATKLNIITSKDANTGRPTVSYDDGKTWEWNDQSSIPAVLGTAVYVYWNKIED